MASDCNKMGSFRDSQQQWRDVQLRIALCYLFNNLKKKDVVGGYGVRFLLVCTTMNQIFYVLFNNMKRRNE